MAFVIRNNYLIDDATGEIVGAINKPAVPQQQVTNVFQEHVNQIVLKHFDETLEEMFKQFMKG